MTGKFIGLDAGSVSVKYAVFESDGTIINTNYVRHKGNPLTVTYELLKELPGDASLSLTGSAGKLIARPFGINPVNEVVALNYSNRELCPDVKTVIEMGGEDSKLLILNEGTVEEFSMNSVCAAGTGSFLDQQAERLNLSIEEFGEMALKSETPPRIAGRCSVFAKSDMIHLQQIATPVEDIVAGLCFAVARNFKGTICKNMYLPAPISFQGGVAANRGVVRAFNSILSTNDLVIPEYFALMSAIGAALKDRAEGIVSPFKVGKLREFIDSLKDEGSSQRPLFDDVEKFEKNHQVSYDLYTPPSGEEVTGYLGIDIGSISTNLVVMDEEERVLAKRYLMTAGRPIEAVKRGLGEIGAELADKVNICGVGTTGSGRYMISDFVGADIVKNEITAQATAAVEIDPEVDTILEIGGQDSKYISIRDGIIVDFEMNKACAAGTGSFLEEQADKLDISIKNEFASSAQCSDKPCTLGERCTVFMENSLLSRQQQGAPKEDLVSGLSYSIVQNYINRVVGDRPIGKKVFFQGGVAFNKAVVAAFEKYLDLHITVPPHHDVTGAIGMALIAKRHMMNNGSTTFKGFDLSKRSYKIKSFECKSCDNMCEINRVKVDGEETPLFYGSRCEKYDVKRGNNGKDKTDIIPDLFAERKSLLMKSHLEYRKLFEEGRKSRNGHKVYRIGVPRVFFFHDFMPFWTTLLWELGFEVELSEETNRQVVDKGVEHILAESCFPHKVAHGHLKDLIDKDVDAIFLPSFINFSTDSKEMRCLACPYVQTMPYLANVAFDNISLIKPIIDFEWGNDYLVKELFKALKLFDVQKSRIKMALSVAEKRQQEFTDAIKNRGKEILDSISERTIVIIGRAYNAFDSGINLEIPKKLRALDVCSIPMDFLPIEKITLSDSWNNMYWRSGQNILKAAEIVRDNPMLFALYIGNFSCGPDSFIHRFFDETMSEKPFLHIEIDEHSADAGVITRCEAFLDSIGGRKEIPVNLHEPMKNLSIGKSTRNKIIYIPRMSDHAFGLAAAFERCGLEAEVMAIPTIESVKLGRRYVSGKECYPCAITTGDMVSKALSKDFDSERAVFFMPSGAGPCRFGQYNVLQRLVLDEVGYSNVPVYSPNQDESFYSELGIVSGDFAKQAWKGIIATDLLVKCLHEKRPYEVNSGETDELYEKYLARIHDVLKIDEGDQMLDLLREMRSSFEVIPIHQIKKPLIGIVGEMFVRHNRFANEDIVKKVEALGGEAWLAPFDEWISYVSFMSLRKSVTRFKNSSFSREVVGDIIRTRTSGFIQKRIEHKYFSIFEGFLHTLNEPSIKELLKNAEPYLDDSFDGEAILSMGKSVDFAKKGVSGIISAMPFGCMPGTIVSALFKAVKRDTGVPCLSASYDGVEASSSRIQLEAFMHQAAEHNKKMTVAD